MSIIPQELHRKIFELTLALYRVTDFFPHGEPIRRNLREKANEIFGSVTEYGHSFDIEREAASILSRINAVRGYLKIAKSQRFVKPINMRVLEREYDRVVAFFERELTKPQEQEYGVKKEFVAPKQAVSSVSKDAIKEKSVFSPWDEIIGEAYEEQEVSFSDDFDSGKQSLKDTTHQKSYISKGHNKGHSDFSSVIKDISDRQKRILEYMQISPRAKISDFFSFFSEISSKTIQRDLQELVDKEFLKKEGDKRWTVYILGQNTTAEARG